MVRFFSCRVDLTRQWILKIKEDSLTRAKMWQQFEQLILDKYAYNQAGLGGQRTPTTY
jgi:hypothetical protein